MFRFESVALIVVITTCSGCGIEPETLAALQDAVNSATDAAQEIPQAEGGEETQAISFTPPYPHRTDPFTFPGRPTEPAIVDREPVTTDDALQPRVLGFANVREPRVLMQIGDSTHSMKVGDRIRSVEVIRIRPPAADLSVLGQVRTITMFDDP